MINNGITVRILKLYTLNTILAILNPEIHFMFSKKKKVIRENCGTHKLLIIIKMNKFYFMKK